MKLKRRFFFPLHNLPKTPPIMCFCSGPQCITLPWLQDGIRKYISTIVSSYEAVSTVPKKEKKAGHMMLFVARDKENPQ